MSSTESSAEVVDGHSARFRRCDLPYLMRIRPGQDLRPKYLAHFMRSPRYWEPVNDAAVGVGLANVNGSKLAAFRISVPPLAEQDLIVQLLDAVDDRARSSARHLMQARKTVERFRRSVITAGCSGRLTADWRGSDDLDGWEPTTLVDVCESITDGDHQAPPQVPTGIPFITISAMSDGFLRLDKATRYVPASYYEALKPSRRPKHGDVLFSVAGSIGIPALVDTSDKFTFQRHIAILRPDTSRISGKYLSYLLRTTDIQEQGVSVATRTAQLTIHLRGFRSFAVTLPSIVEQDEIVRQIERLFEHAERIEAHISASQRRIERSSQAVLDKAFRGDISSSPDGVDA